MRRILALLLLTTCLPASAQEAQDSIAVPPKAQWESLPGEGSLRFGFGWFDKLWNNKRAAWAVDAAMGEGAVVFLGDSITQGWGAHLAKAFPGMKLANRGISGDTTRGMLIRLSGDVLAVKPSAVVLLMGTNDLEEDDPLASTLANARKIIDAIKAHDPKLPIVLNLVLPSSPTKKRPTEKIYAMNEGFLQLAKGDAQITVLDTWTLFANPEGEAIPNAFRDLLHLNATGYEMWAAALRPVFATLGFTETEAEPFELEEGFTSLFNGKDLTGWGFQPTKPRKPSKNPNAPVFAEVKEAEDFAGQAESSDRRYRAIAGRLVVATPPEGRRIQQLWTTKEFEKDFELRLEFRATPNADSGIFLKGKQLQCRDYPLAGPYKELTKYRSGGWNEIVIKVTGTTAHCTCNGEVLEEAYEIPEKGRIGLEGDRGQIEYRRIRIRES